MSRDALTEKYMERIGGRLLGPVRKSEAGRAFYGDAYAPRPVFLSAAETWQLSRDLEVLRGALYRLPGLLFEGDLAAFAHANGTEDVQVRAIERASAGVPNPPTSMCRADLYHDQTGFRLMEINMGGTIGFEVDICRGFLEDPELSRFAAEEGLRHVDSLPEQVRTLRAEMELAPDARPVVAHVEWPRHMAVNEPYMSAMCKRWGEYGLEARPCHVGQLERRDGRLWLEDRPIDIVYRQFLLEDLLSDDADVLMEPLLGALESGEVRMFTSLESELYGSKASLAMLSNRAHRHLFSEEELDVIDRLLPWTAPVTPGTVILEDGTETSLLDHAMAAQHELILKPTLLHGGQGVIPGWSSDITPDQWRKLLLDAMDGPYVLQRRIHPVPEPFPEPDGESRPWIVSWGVVMMACGHGGFFTRCAPAEAGKDVLNLFQGALVGSGFQFGPGPRCHYQ
ncbi:hypothetical protein [Streptomyces luteireticuli]|uniref:Glutathionylspermidine synthase family protein n=1 Tax=Streptomyces luteireticuli TaxID=173858 RepID=A0ABN0Z980_9ACTN